MSNDVFIWTSQESFLIKDNLAGYIITDNSIIMGNKGLKSYKKEGHQIELLNKVNNGKYCLTLKILDEIVISADFFGLENIYYYHNGNNWAVSNSFLKLARKVKELNWSNQFYDPAFATYTMKKEGFFFGQLVSNRTLFQNIRLLSNQDYISIKNDKFIIKSKKRSIKIVHNYQQQIEEFINVSMNRMSGFVKLVKDNNYVDLSGGQDSRLVFGMCAKSQFLRENVCSRSDKGRVDEFEIASKLSSHYKVKLKNSYYKGPKIDGRDAFELWALANAGVYRPLNKPITTKMRKLIHFNGSSFIGSSYVKTPPFEKLAFWESLTDTSTFDLIKTEFLNSFEEMDIDPNDSKAMAMHYMNRRARIHYGRAWYSHLSWFNWSPLLCTEFYDLVETGMSLGFDKDKIMCDIMMSVDPKLAQFKFSNTKSQFSQEYIDLSLSQISPINYIEKNDLKVYGELLDYENDDLLDDRIEFLNVMKESLIKNTSIILDTSSYYSKKDINLLLKKMEVGLDSNDQMSLSSLVSLGLLSDLKN